MATEKQLAANRQNSLKAGVKSAAGKAVVRHNAFKHGLTANSLLSDLESIHESTKQYRDISEGLTRSLQPSNYLEQFLVDLMARSILKLNRYEVAEKQNFRDEEELCFSLSSKHRPVHLSPGSEHKLELLLKYKQGIDSQFYRALECIIKLRQGANLDLFLKTGGGYEPSKTD